MTTGVPRTYRDCETCRMLGISTVRAEDAVQILARRLVRAAEGSTAQKRLLEQLAPAKAERASQRRQRDEHDAVCDAPEFAHKMNKGCGRDERVI